MKKSIKVIAFNAIFALLAIFCFSDKFFGLGFDLKSLGELKFAISITVLIILVLLFSYVNYILLIDSRKVEYTAKQIITLDSCIENLAKCFKTDPALKSEIQQAILQLQTFKRKREDLNILLGENESIKDLVFQTVDTAESYACKNAIKILQQLVIFDNDAFLKIKDSVEIETHRNIITAALKSNTDILKEYNNLMIAASNALISKDVISLDAITTTTQALNAVFPKS